MRTTTSTHFSSGRQRLWLIAIVVATLLAVRRRQPISRRELQGPLKFLLAYPGTYHRARGLAYQGVLFAQERELDRAREQLQAALDSFTRCSALPYAAATRLALASLTEDRDVAHEHRTQGLPRWLATSTPMAVAPIPAPRPGNARPSTRTGSASRSARTRPCRSMPCTCRSASMAFVRECCSTSTSTVRTIRRSKDSSESPDQRPETIAEDARGGAAWKLVGRGVWLTEN